MVSARGVGRGWGKLDGLEFPLERKQVSTRDKNEGLNGGGGGGPHVGCRLKFHYFVGCRLKVSTFVGCR